MTRITAMLVTAVSTFSSAVPDSSTCKCAAVRLFGEVPRLHPDGMDHFMKYHVEPHIEDLRRDARRAGMGAPAARSGPRRVDSATAITIRFASGGDAAVLRRVAELDSANVPAAPVLLAMVDGDVRAAMSLADGAVVGDPLHSTAETVELLNRRARRAGKTEDRKSALESR
jgi:hypothetical protein